MDRSENANEKNPPQNSGWLSVYIYYHKPFDTILKTLIKPIVNKLIAEGTIEQFFFIQYFDAGPHIRLRLKGDVQALEKIVRPYVTNRVNKYLSKFPSSSEASDDNSGWLVNSMSFEKYEPEIERYGGKDAIGIAERHFESSSETILNILAENRDWDYGSAMGHIVKLHISFVHAANMGIGQAKNFFEYLCDCWDPTMFVRVKVDSPINSPVHRDLLIRSFENHFLLQKNRYISTTRSLWNALENNTEFEEEWLNKWVSQSKEINGQLQQLLSDKLLIGPPKNERYLAISPIWTIFNSYFHMTNNRMGISNHDEPFLAYLIKRSFDEAF